MTIQPYDFPESRTESTGAGPDFPGSSGDREKGKFRPSGTPRLTLVAVSDDEGKPVVKTTDELLAELLLWQKAAVLALALQMELNVTNLINDASKL